MPPIPAPFRGDEFTTATLLPIAAAQASSEWRCVPPPGWTGKFLDEMYETDQPGATLTITANTTAIGVYLIQTTDSGRITWSLDGGAEQVQDLWAGWLGKGGLYVRNFLSATGPAAQRPCPEGDRPDQVREVGGQRRPYWRLLCDQSAGPLTAGSPPRPRVPV